MRRTFDLVVPISGVAADMFYERLFYMAPSLRRMFPEDMRDQKRKLIMMLAMAVNGLNDLDTLAPQLMALGARHAGYGVKDYHYKTVGEALIWTLGARACRPVHARGASAPGCGSICWLPRPCRPAPTKSPPCRRRSDVGPNDNHLGRWTRPLARRCAERIVDDLVQARCVHRKTRLDPGLLGARQCRAE